MMEALSAPAGGGIAAIERSLGHRESRPATTASCTLFHVVERATSPRLATDDAGECNFGGSKSCIKMRYMQFALLVLAVFSYLPRCVYFREV